MVHHRAEIAPLLPRLEQCVERRLEANKLFPQTLERTAALVFRCRLVRAPICSARGLRASEETHVRDERAHRARPGRRRDMLHECRRRLALAESTQPFRERLEALIRLNKILLNALLRHAFRLTRCAARRCAARLRAATRGGTPRARCGRSLDMHRCLRRLERGAREALHQRRELIGHRADELLNVNI